MDHSTSAEESILWRDCLEITKQLLAKNVDFCFSLRFGPTFSFSLDTQKVRNHQHSDLPGSKVKQSSPSNRRRNKMRLEAFLAKKRAIAVSSTSSPQSESGGHSMENPGKTPNQTAPGTKVRSRMEINLPATSTNEVDSEGESSSHKKMDVNEIKMSAQEHLDDLRRMQERNRRVEQRNKEESEKRHQALKKLFELDKFR